MSSRVRSSRSSRPRSGRPHAAGPVLTALVLAFALFAQAGLSAVHGLSHAASRASEIAVGCEAVHDRHLAHDEQGFGDHRHEPASDSCDLCALIAIGRFGWALPAATVVVGAELVVDGRADLPSSRTLRPSLVSAAPRGPPVV